MGFHSCAELLIISYIQTFKYCFLPYTYEVCLIASLVIPTIEIFAQTDLFCFHTLLGSCSSILCYLLLPGRIDWNEIPLFHPRIFNTKMFRKVTDVCSLHAPITETIPELIHTILPRWSITSKICFFTRLYIYVNCIFRAIELHAEPGLIRAGWSTCAYLYQPTGQSPHKKLFVNFEFWVHTCFKNNSK